MNTEEKIEKTNLMLSKLFNLFVKDEDQIKSLRLKLFGDNYNPNYKENLFSRLFSFLFFNKETFNLDDDFRDGVRFSFKGFNIIAALAVAIMSIPLMAFFDIYTCLINAFVIFLFSNILFLRLFIREIIKYNKFSERLISFKSKSEVEKLFCQHDLCRSKEYLMGVLEKEDLKEFIIFIKEHYKEEDEILVLLKDKKIEEPSSIYELLISLKKKYIKELKEEELRKKIDSDKKQKEENIKQQNEKIKETYSEGINRNKNILQLFV